MIEIETEYPYIYRMQAGQKDIYTVSAVNKMARYLIEESFPSLWVEGEIANYHHHGSGHRYFSLRDDNSQIRCAMWRSSAASLKFEPKDGLKVIANGSLTIYEKGGTYQLSVRRLVPSGIGELELALRQLKEKLAAEGLFDEDHKQVLPTYPMRIGVVTSPTGAVIHDIIRVTRRRNPKLDIILYPSEVQGDIAPPQLAEGIRRFNEYRKVDVIIIGRGGGSLEDLWAFNDERVVRAVYDSEIPVVSAVGHEVDFTLTDLVADVSAATPSMAAELVAWPLEDFISGLDSFIFEFGRTVRDIYSERKRRFLELAESPVFKRPESMLEQRYQSLDRQIQLLRLLSENRFDTFYKNVGLHTAKLEALSPLAVLNRGYSVTRTADKHSVIASIGDVIAGDEIETIVKNGTLVSTINRVDKKIG